MARYTILGELGRGGMGTVYRAQDHQMEREVALKILTRSGDSAGDAIQRFKREMKVSAELAHPNIVRIFDSGLMDGRPYYTMEIVDGIDLERLYEKAGGLPIDRAVRIIAQAADALACIHAHDLVHRDIKPSNLMLTSDERLVVMDFGLARENTATLLTQEGSLVGTPRFLAPESIRGAAPSAAQDVFALALTAHELLVGHHWIQAESIQQLANAIVNGEPPSVERERPDLPAWLAQVQARVLSKDPANRPTAAAYRNALEARSAAAAQGRLLASSGLTRLATESASAQPPTTSWSLGGGCADLPPGVADKDTSDAFVGIEILASSSRVYGPRKLQSQQVLTFQMPPEVLASARRTQLVFRTGDMDFWRDADAIWLDLNGDFRFVLVAHEMFWEVNGPVRKPSLAQNVPPDWLRPGTNTLAITHEFLARPGTSGPFLSICDPQVRVWEKRHP